MEQADLKYEALKKKKIKMVDILESTLLNKDLELERLRKELENVHD